MRAPFVSRRRHDDVVAELRQTIRERDRQLARLGHRIVETKREHAKLLTDLRLVRTRIDYPTPRSNKIGFSFQLHEAVFDGFRHDRRFVELVAQMVEQMMMSEPEGRSRLAGLFTPERVAAGGAAE